MSATSQPTRQPLEQRSGQFGKPASDRSSAAQGVVRATPRNPLGHFPFAWACRLPIPRLTASGARARPR
jgi:hypothetical protein